MVTEQQLKDVFMSLWETEFKSKQPFEEFADGYDCWVDWRNNVLVEKRDVIPFGAVKRVAHVDKGEFYIYPNARLKE